MSAKVAIIIGDYSNGWSDAIIVQDYLPFEAKKLHNDRQSVMGKMTEKLLSFIADMEGNETINPVPIDEKCCAAFEEWGKEQKVISAVKLCPFCGTKITHERKEKYFTKADF